jgi:hypothetical protein
MYPVFTFTYNLLYLRQIMRSGFHLKIEQLLFEMTMGRLLIEKQRSCGPWREAPATIGWVRNCFSLTISIPKGNLNSVQVMVMDSLARQDK